MSTVEAYERIDELIRHLASLSRDDIAGAMSVTKELRPLLFAEIEVRGGLTHPLVELSKEPDCAKYTALIFRTPKKDKTAWWFRFTNAVGIVEPEPKIESVTTPPPGIIVDAEHVRPIQRERAETIAEFWTRQTGRQVLEVVRAHAPYRFLLLDVTRAHWAVLHARAPEISIIDTVRVPGTFNAEQAGTIDHMLCVQYERGRAQQMADTAGQLEKIESQVRGLFLSHNITL